VYPPDGRKRSVALTWVTIKNDRQPLITLRAAESSVDAKERILPSGELRRVAEACVL